MDVDTIFPAISLGEEVVGKYQDSLFWGRLQMTVIITNLRLLIRRNFISCGFFAPSYHSSINLRSIHRIDDTASSPSWALLFPLLIVLSSGLGIFLVGLMLDHVTVIFMIFGIVLIVLSIVGFILLFISNTRRYIQVKGTFGTAVFKFPENTARELDARVSEMIYQRKIQQKTIATNSPNQKSSSLYPTQNLYPNVQ